MQYIYTQNPTAKRPIILVDKYIGIDNKGVEGIMGGQFAREIFALENAGIKEAEILINSKGGQWSEAVNMVGAMSNSSIDFTTVNMGYVDSAAGHVFQQGKKRVWMNYALGLVHNIQGGASDSIKEAMNTSIATMLSEKTNRTNEQVRELMNAETMMTSEMAEKYKFCDVVKPCADVLSLTNSSDANEVISFGQTQTKKLLPKNKSMEALNQVLGLTNEASEAAQLAAINKIIEARSAAETTLTGKVTELTNANIALTDTKGKLLVAENALLAATNESKKVAAEALVKEHTGTRIVNDPAQIEKWTNAAIENYAGAKSLIEGINLNIKAPATPAQGQRSKDAPIISAAEYMARK